MPPKKDADPEMERATPRTGPPVPILVALGGGPYALDNEGQMYRVDAGQETTEGPEGPVTKNVAVLTKIALRLADSA